MACNSHFPTQIGCGQSQCRHLVPVSVSGPKNRRRTTNNIISGNLHIPGALHAGTPQVRRTHGAALDRPIHRIPRKRIINWLLNRPRHSEFTILICPRCQDPQQVIRRHDSNHNTLDRNVISGNIVPNLNLSGRNVRNYFPRMAPVVDQSRASAQTRSAHTGSATPRSVTDGSYNSFKTSLAIVSGKTTVVRSTA